MVLSTKDVVKIFGVSQQPRARENRHSAAFCLSQSRVHPNRNETQRGKAVTIRRTSQTLWWRRGIPSRKHVKKGCSHPTFDNLFTRYILAKKKVSGWLGRVQGARQTLQILIWSRFDGENRRRRRRKAVSPLLSNVFWGGCTPFCQIPYVIYGQNIMSAQMLEVSLFGVGPVLRLERYAWSMVK